MAALLGLQPYIGISPESGGARKAIAWYVKVFGAKVKTAMACGENDEKVGHAELVFGGNNIMISDVFPGMGAKTPDQLGGTPVTIVLAYQNGAKAVYDSAVKEGATVPEGREFKEQPWGWDSGAIVDPFGYQWMIGENTKNWSDEETRKQMKMKSIASEF
jgi:PhnB protein